MRKFSEKISRKFSRLNYIAVFGGLRILNSIHSCMSIPEKSLEGLVVGDQSRDTRGNVIQTSIRVIISKLVIYISKS